MNENSLWRTNAPAYQNFPSLNDELKCDVVIIGAGITGLTTAYELVQEGKEVVVLEAEKAGCGTTGFSSSHLNTQIDNSYSSVIQDFGEETARMVARSRVEGINYIDRLCSQLNIKCEFQRVFGCYFTEDTDKVKPLEKEYEASGIVGLDIALLDDISFPGPIKKAIVYKGQAKFNSQSYLNGLLKELSTHPSCRILEKSRVTEIDFEKSEAKTANGLVKASYIVMATHLPLFIDVLQTMNAPYRSYIVAGEYDGPLEDGLFWDDQDPYHYTRLYNSKGKKWLVLGGADNKTGHNPKDHKPYHQLEKYAKERFNIKEIVHRWSAQFYRPVDGLPYIGNSPFKDILVATGFSGDGLVYGTIAAKIISDKICGHVNPYAQIYDAGRFKPMASAREFFNNNIHVAKNLIGDRIYNRKEITSLQPYEGKVIENGKGKTAIAKDATGKIHRLSAVCPHMKCIVHWNETDHTWDCPCHGSRFTIEGKVVTGPAVSDLENLNEIDSSEDNSQMKAKTKKS